MFNNVPQEVVQTANIMAMMVSQLANQMFQNVPLTFHNVPKRSKTFQNVPKESTAFLNVSKQSFQTVPQKVLKTVNIMALMVSQLVNQMFQNCP
jgi:hypothetical protein